MQITLPVDRLTQDPVHLIRDTEMFMSAQQQAALRFVYNSVLPHVWEIKAQYQVPWIANVYTIGEQNLVIPEAIYLLQKEAFDAAGFTVVVRKPLLASQDGLMEALQQGSDMQKKWV